MGLADIFAGNLYPKVVDQTRGAEIDVLAFPALVEMLASGTPWVYSVESKYVAWPWSVNWILAVTT